MTDFNPYKFVLVGSLEGQTINLGGHQFIDGVYTLTGPEEHIAPSLEEANLKAIYLGKSYQAFREGSPEHQEAVDRLAKGETPPGELDVAERERQEQANNFQQPPAAEPPVVEPEAEKQDEPAGEPEKQEEPEAGNNVAPATQSARQKQGALRSALLKLDAKDDNHWTDNGLPSVAAVRQLAEDDSISRANINELAPQLTREEAAKVAAGN
jgi:hypothetical protein